jgi:hypothetical protein
MAARAREALAYTASSWSSQIQTLVRNDRSTLSQPTFLVLDLTTGPKMAGGVARLMTSLIAKLD